MAQLTLETAVKIIRGLRDGPFSPLSAPTTVIVEFSGKSHHCHAVSARFPRNRGTRVDMAGLNSRLGEVSGKQGESGRDSAAADSRPVTREA